ncbi:MAG: VOC family protein [Erysipelotrichaceae bacterium]
MQSFVVFYPCIDLEVTKSFYLDKMNLKIWYEREHVVIFDTGYGYLGFSPRLDRPLATSTIISFNCSDVQEVDTLYKKYYEMDDIRILSYPQKQNDYEVYSFFIEDPNGYKLEFQKILDLV